MKTSNICPKCSAREVAGNVPILDRDDNLDRELSVRINRGLRGQFFQNFSDFSLRAYICTSCGFTEFYLDNPERFGQVWKDTEKENNQL